MMEDLHRHGANLTVGGQPYNNLVALIHGSAPSPALLRRLYDKVALVLVLVLVLGGYVCG